MNPVNRGAALPARGQKRWYRIVSPTRGLPLRAVILGWDFFAVWTHYVPPTLPCTLTADCHWCKAGFGPRYIGYVACIAGERREPHVLGLTYGACCQLIEMIKSRGPLRGWDVTLQRIYKSEKAPIQVVYHRTIEENRLIPHFDEADSLARMWGVNEDFLKRGCRRLTESENTARYIRQRMQARIGHNQETTSHLSPENHS